VAYTVDWNRCGEFSYLYRL